MTFNFQCQNQKQFIFKQVTNFLIHEKSFEVNCY